MVKRTVIVLVTAVILFAAGSASAPAETVVVAASPGDFTLKAAVASSPPLAGVVTGTNPWSIVLDPHAGMIYWSSVTEGTIQRVPVGGGEPETIFEKDGSIPRALALDPDGSRLYWVDSASDTLMVVRLADLMVDDLAGGFIRPCDAALDAAAGRLFISDSGLDAILVYDLKAGTLDFFLESKETIGIWGLAVSPDARQLYFANHELGAVFRMPLDKPGAGPEAVAEKLLGPRGIAFDRARRLLFILESGSDGISVFDTHNATLERDIIGVADNGRGLVVFADEDRDGDFIDDEWEHRFFRRTDRTDGGGNGDGDPRSDRDEFFFGSDPRIPDGGPFQDVKITEIPGAPGEMMLETMFQRRRGTALCVVMRHSPNLTDWAMVTEGLREEIMPIDEEFEEVRLTIDLEAAGIGDGSVRTFFLPAVQSEAGAP